MKKNYWFVILTVAVLLGMTSCSSDKGVDPSPTPTPTPTPTVSTEYVRCVEQLLDGCIDIANEVGDAKIGDPLALYRSGKTTEALYAVESWFSWHSREDYMNNILSVRNSYYGSLDGKVSEKSLSALVKKADSSRDEEICQAIEAAYRAIEAIPQPFRNHIDSKESEEAQEACIALSEVLDNLKGYIRNHDDIFQDENLKEVVINYVDAVVMPTYRNLKEKNTALNQAVATFATTPTDANFEAICTAWLEARQPWETSEAFLFGPVDELGLDPNMDSWPLDVEAIVNILQSGAYDNLDWSNGDKDDEIEAKQSVRGFHTLEFLCFKDGKPRLAQPSNPHTTGTYELDYYDGNAKSWRNYMVQVATLLQQDATTLYEEWANSYAEKFKNHQIE